MPFDQPTRNRLARFVADVRGLLTEEFTRQLQNEYGLDPSTGAVTDLARLTHLDDARRATARILRATLDHYLATLNATGVKARQEALDRIVREQAFTVLNRLCALRMAEARDLLIESIARGYQSKGFLLYARLAGNALGETGDAYRAYLFSLFDEFAVDLAVLFDRFSPQGRLFPGESALLRVLAQLNHPDIDTLWAEDETIGWIYQYFNSKEERKAMRDASQAPRNSRELAVRNQFFTPRYVVEFLTDNTLGRIWYEMTKGETGLKDTCRYLVRRPNEIFLQEGEAAPAQEPPADDLSQEELLKQPVYLPHRLLKDPRELKMLDPACGSMHFGLYAFDLFERIYEEAWDLGRGMRGDATLAQQADSPAPHAPTDLAADYATKEELLRDLPRLILEHNIHGIDIDPRAVQIAGLSLWLRAQRSWQAQGVKAQDRPQIRRSNIVCAEPMPGEIAMLAEFAATLQPPVLGQLVQVVFEKMKLAGEAGSLLKIEEELAGAVAEAKQKWLAGGKPAQTSLFPDDTPRQRGFELDLSGITDEAFWDRAEALVLDTLQEYAEQAENGDSYQRRLFVGDTARGFALIDLCQKRYDVILMNPPFGETSESTETYLEDTYPKSKHDVYGCFIEVALDRRHEDGLIGAITSRTWMFLPRRSELRIDVIARQSRVLCLADLGHYVLDAAVVETCAFVLGSFKVLTNGIYFRLVDISSRDKQQVLRDAIAEPIYDRRFEVNQDRFHLLPGSPFAYWISSHLFIIMSSGRRFGDEWDIFPGLTTRDNDRFARSPLEVPRQLLERRWFWFAKGGDFSPYYFDTELVLNYANDGSELKAWINSLGEAVTRFIASQRHYLRPGFTYPRITIKGFNVRLLRQGHIFAEKGISIFPKNKDQRPDLAALAYLNSGLVQELLLTMAPSRSWEKSFVASLPTLPLDDISLLDATEVIVNQLMKTLTRDVTSNLFITIPFFPSIISSFEHLKGDQERAQYAVAEKSRETSILVRKFFECETKTDEEFRSDPWEAAFRFQSVEDLTCCSVDYIVGCVFGRWDIRYATGKKFAPELPDPFAPLPICPPGMLQNAQELPATSADVPADYPLRISWPGILVDDEDHPEDIVRRVRAVLQVIWPENHDAIEGEACDLLGVRTLRDYFRKPAAFFADHLKRYSKSRRQAPIYWPLSTGSGSYTLWLYYHRLTGQTLYTCVNDFVDPKLKSVTEAASVLRQKSNRTRSEEKELEQLSDLALDLQDFRSELLRIAAFWQPNLNDGVQITAAPLWRLFQHRPWQKRLKETWEKLESGDYDWAHLAYTVWPERIAAKCKTDKSLAIAHDLEYLYVEPPASTKKKAQRRHEADEVDEQSELFDDA